MRTKRYLPKIQNGAVARRQVRSKNPATARAFGKLGARKSAAPSRSRGAANRAGARHDGEGRGSKVMWTMILIGVTLAAVFVFALRSQINAYRLAQAEEQLRQKLDQYSAQQKFLTLDQQRAMNTSESDRAGREGGLNQLKLDTQSSLRGASIQKAVHQLSEPAKASQASQEDETPVSARSVQAPAAQPVRQSGKPSGRQPGKPSGKAGQNAMGAKAAKAQKGAASAKLAKSNAAKSNIAKAGAAKAGKASSQAKAAAAKTKKREENQRLALRAHPRR
jgi:hypothetical protein